MTIPYPATPQPQRLPAPYIRPPLDARSRRGARIAGMVGFGLISLGYGLFALVVTTALLGTAVVYVLSQITDSDSSADAFQKTLDGFNAPLWIAVFVIVAAVGVVLWVAGLLLSPRILKAHNVNKPWPITWSAFGIAVVLSWFADGFLGGIGFSVGSVVGDGPSGPNILYAVAIGIGLLLSVVANVFIGWLSWLWMTIALRPRA